MKRRHAFNHSLIQRLASPPCAQGMEREMREGGVFPVFTYKSKYSRDWINRMSSHGKMAYNTKTPYHLCTRGSFFHNCVNVTISNRATMHRNRKSTRSDCFNFRWFSLYVVFFSGSYIVVVSETEHSGIYASLAYFGEQMSAMSVLGHQMGLGPRPYCLPKPRFLPWYLQGFPIFNRVCPNHYELGMRKFYVNSEKALNIGSGTSYRHPDSVGLALLRKNFQILLREHEDYESYIYSLFYLQDPSIFERYC